MRPLLGLSHMHCRPPCFSKAGHLEDLVTVHRPYREVALTGITRSHQIIHASRLWDHESGAELAQWNTSSCAAEAGALRPPNGHSVPDQPDQDAPDTAEAAADAQPPADATERADVSLQDADMEEEDAEGTAAPADAHAVLEMAVDRTG